MLQIRRNTFETNSSSTHNLVIGMAKEMDAWMEGKTLYCMYEYHDGPFKVGQFYDKEYVDNYIKVQNPEYADEPEEMYGDYDLYTFDRFGDYLEVDTNTFTTPSGEVIKIACQYGYDG